MSLSKRIKSSKKLLTRLHKQGIKYWDTYQVRVVGVVLVLFSILFAASIVTQAEEAEDSLTEQPIKKVEAIIFGLEENSTTAVGEVKNLSTVTLVAQSNGPISNLPVVEGAQLWKGAIIAQQSSAYATGNAATVQRQTAQRNFGFSETQLQNTSTLVAQTREQADKSRENTEELRKITQNSIGETRDIIAISETQLLELETQLSDAISGGASSSTITGIRSGVLATKNGIAAAKSQLRSLEYRVDTDNPPEDLANLGRDMVYATTELQLETAKMQRDIAQLSLRSAYIAEAATRVQAPFAGRLEKLYVTEGQFVTAGTPVAVLKGVDTKLCFQIPVSGALASRIDAAKSLQVKIGGELLDLPITHVSQTGVAGSLHEVLAIIPESESEKIYEGQHLEAILPLFDSLSSSQVITTVPLDSVFITNTETFVYVIADGVVVQRVVELGEIISEQVEIISGLTVGDQVILDRTVTSGEKVTVNSL